jgi:putative ABC transport system permease protein
MLALTEIRRRKVQFGLVTGVVVLISYLVLMVTGLGLGLQERAGTALLALDGDHLVYSDRTDLSVIRSRLTFAQVADIADAPGVQEATPLGYVAAVVEYRPGETDTAAVLGVEPGSFAEPRVLSGRPLSNAGSEILIDRAWAQLHNLDVGDEVALPIGFETKPFTVVGIVDQGYFFFLSATYVSLPDWRGLVFQGAEEATPAASIVLARGSGLNGLRGNGWLVVTKQEGFNNIEGVAAQQSTVNALRYMGLLIGAMVIGVFFYVITLQKVALLGILKAIGASGTFLTLQGLLQVALVSLAGVSIAIGLAVLTERTLLAGGLVPISFTAGAMASTAVFVLIAGLVGASLSARQVGSIDPIVAMQQQ